MRGEPVELDCPFCGKGKFRLGIFLGLLLLKEVVLEHCLGNSQKLKTLMFG
jgi:hypothetical protein